MDKDTISQTLLRTTQNAYCENTEMMDFAPFPNNIISQEVTPYYCKCSDYLGGDKYLISNNYPELAKGNH